MWGNNSICYSCIYLSYLLYDSQKIKYQWMFLNIIIHVLIHLKIFHLVLWHSSLCCGIAHALCKHPPPTDLPSNFTMMSFMNSVFEVFPNNIDMDIVRVHHPTVFISFSGTPGYFVLKTSIAVMHHWSQNVLMTISKLEAFNIHDLALPSEILISLSHEWFHCAAQVEITDVTWLWHYSDGPENQDAELISNMHKCSHLVIGCVLICSCDIRCKINKFCCTTGSGYADYIVFQPFQLSCWE